MLSPAATKLHQLMLATKPQGQTYTQNDLLELLDSKSLKILAELSQELVDQHMVRLSKEEDKLCFKPIPLATAEKIKSMSRDEQIIYHHIEAAGREGIWTKTIKLKTNLHQQVVSRCLKSMEGLRYIKTVKSVKFPTRKIYMLYELQPSLDVTGGPWFTDNELDVEFIRSLLVIIWRYVGEKSYPNAFKPHATQKKDKEGVEVEQTPPIQQSYTHNYVGYATIPEIQQFIVGSHITTVDLTVHNIRSLCEVLVYEDKFERWDGGSTYRVTWYSLMEAGGTDMKLDDDYDQELEIQNGNGTIKNQIEDSNVEKSFASLNFSNDIMKYFEFDSLDLCKGFSGISGRSTTFETNDTDDHGGIYLDDWLN